MRRVRNRSCDTADFAAALAVDALVLAVLVLELVAATLMEIPCQLML
jgi:hypothetical protein